MVLEVSPHSGDFGGNKMQPAYYLDKVTVVPVEGLTRKEVLGGIAFSDSYHPEYNMVKVQAAQEKILEMLQRLLPAYIDGDVQPVVGPPMGVFYETHYNIPLSHGRVAVRLSVQDDLGKNLTDDGSCLNYIDYSKRKELANNLGSQSGVILSGDYHWGGNDGKGLQLGRFQNSLAGFSSSDTSMAFQRVLNAFCRGIALTPELAYAKAGEFSTPLSYSDGTKEIDADIRNLSLDAVKAMDKPVSEFMTWMQENAVQVNTVGELVRLAVHSYAVARNHTRRAEAGRVSSGLVSLVEEAGNKYLKSAQVAAVELCPPHNNRMEYLVQ